MCFRCLRARIRLGKCRTPNWLQTFPGFKRPENGEVLRSMTLQGLTLETAMPGSIQGQKWSDVNGNGQKDAGEPGLVGWTIYLIPTQWEPRFRRAVDDDRRGRNYT